MNKFSDNDTVLVEYDIVYTREQWNQIQQAERSYKAISYSSNRWTNKVVPYKYGDTSFCKYKLSLDFQYKKVAQYTH